MGSRLRQFRVPAVAVALGAIVCTAALVSSAMGSAFPGANGKLVYAVHKGSKPGYLATAKPNGSGATRITKPGAKQQGDMQPRYSADGTKIVFTRNPASLGYNKLQVWVANANGTAAHRVKVAGLPKGDFPSAPTFTPNGKAIVFEADNINAPAGIWKVAVGGGKASRLTSGNDYQPAVSPDGKKVAFMRALTLVIARIDGSHPQVLYTEPSGTSSMDEPDFSPNGKTIAFMAFKSSTDVWDIWTVPADGSGSGTATNLTNGTTVSSLDPAYSPDGTKLAFTSADNTIYGPSTTSIDVMPASGGAATAVVTPASGEFVYEPDWGVRPHKHHHHKHKN